MGQIIAGVVGAALVVFVLVRLFGRRGPTPNSRELAMGVWAAFGPYESVEDAEGSLCRSIRAVFGESNLSEHAAWIKGHADNFRMWEKSGTLKQSMEFMRRGLAAFAAGPDFEAACAKFKEESKFEALRLLDKITTDLGMERQAPALRALIDGSMPPGQIHEELEASEKRPLSASSESLEKMSSMLLRRRRPACGSSFRNSAVSTMERKLPRQKPAGCCI